MSRYSIEPLTGEFRVFVDKQIAEGWAGPFMVTRGVVHDTRTHPGFIARENEDPIGYTLYNFANGDCEITLLEILRENKGIGSALVNAVKAKAKKAGCRRVWLITTNDNTRAIRFYQRIGFTLRAVYINALDEARKLKAQIPLTGCDGIPIAHEFEFEFLLGSDLGSDKGSV